MSLALVAGTALQGAAGAQELRPGISYFGLPAASGEASVQFGERIAQVNGVKAGGGVVWLTVWLEHVDHAVTRIVRKLGFETDADADGKIEINTESKIPTASMWMVVDVDAPALDVEPAQAQRFDAQSFDIVAPEAYSIRPLAISLRELENTAPFFESRGTDLEVLWLRPQTGVWHARIRDGHTQLDNLKDRKLFFDAAEFSAVYPEKLEPPEAPRAGDILLGIEVTSLRTFVAKVEK